MALAGKKMLAPQLHSSEEEVEVERSWVGGGGPPATGRMGEPSGVLQSGCAL